MPSSNAALYDNLRLAPFRERLIQGLRTEIAAQIPSREVNVDVLEEELRQVRVEQRRLARAIAMAEEIPELVSELQRRVARRAHLE